MPTRILKKHAKHQGVQAHSLTSHKNVKNSIMHPAGCISSAVVLTVTLAQQSSPHSTPALVLWKLWHASCWTGRWVLSWGRMGSGFCRIFLLGDDLAMPCLRCGRKTKQNKKKQNAERQPGDQMALGGGGCVVFIQGRSCPQLAAAHFARAGAFIGTDAAVGFACPSQSHPIFSLPLPLAAHWFRSSSGSWECSAGDFTSQMVVPKHTGRPESGQFSRLLSACQPWKAVWFPLGPLASILIK